MQMKPLNEATRRYIEQHAGDDVRQLALRGTKDEAVELTLALEQIAGRQTARRKLPTWAALDGIVYPPHLSLEQCSSEPAARYKARVVRRVVTRRRLMADLTGGMGVDFSFMAPLFDEAVYVEQNAQLCAISSHNLPFFAEKVNILNSDGMEAFRRLAPVDLVYLDPARRDSHGARTYGISDCTPDVLALKDELLAGAGVVLLKLSPILDWRKAVSDLGPSAVSEVHIVSVGNECKELLLVLRQPGPGGQPEAGRLVCANDDSLFEVPLAPGGTLAAPVAPAVASAPLAADGGEPCGGYLFEPNASIMKAGCFEAVAARYGVRPVAPNSHLFVAPAWVDGFPGRGFVLQAVTSLNKRALRQSLGGLRQANVAVRNFPLSVAELRRRLKLSEGGSTYLFATTLASGEHALLVCRKP